jgi:enoyl-CoA hydratase/carnithine racemase
MAVVAGMVVFLCVPSVSALDRSEMSDQELIDTMRKEYVNAKKTAKPEEVVLYEVKDNIAYITLNDPGNRNKLEPETCNALGDAWIRFGKDPEAKVAILSANGPDFCIGANIASQGLVKVLGRAFPPSGTQLTKPIIGAVHGTVTGSGIGLAELADITYATRDTWFRFSEVSVGIVGGVLNYKPYMPLKVTMEFLLAGQPMRAQRAYEVGLVNKVLADKQELMAEAVKMANILKKNAPLSLRVLKYGLYKSIETEAQRAKREADYEFDTYIKSQLYSKDFQEGIKALFELREPQFKGK